MTTASNDVRAVLLVAARGGLPFARLHGEPLLAHALRALLAAAPAGAVTVVVDAGSRAETQAVVTASRGRAEILDARSWWAGRGRHADVLHDALCPLVPTGFLADIVSRAADGAACAAYRPVTDTVKTAADGRISGTLDRDRLGIVVAPVVLPPGMGAGEPPPPLGFAALVDWLRARTQVELVRAPSLSRRVDDEGGVMLLECLDETARRVR